MPVEDKTGLLKKKNRRPVIAKSAWCKTPCTSPNKLCTTVYTYLVSTPLAFAVYKESTSDGTRCDSQNDVDLDILYYGSQWIWIFT